MKQIITEWLQDVALMMGLGLAMAWTGAELQWFHMVFIAVALIIYGIMQGRRAIRWYRSKTVPAVSLTKTEFDAWLRSHGVDPAKAVVQSQDCLCTEEALVPDCLKHHPEYTK